MNDILTENRSAATPIPAKAPAPDSADSLMQSWTGPKIRDLIRSPDLRRMYERWLTLVGGKLPRLKEIIGPDQQQIALGNTMLLLHLPDDFIFIQHGAASVKMIGANLTGVLLSERQNPIAKAIRKVYASCIEVAEPFYVRHVASSISSNQYFFLEQVVLPIAADEGRQARFLLTCNAPLDDKNEVLKAIFERSPVGMIAASSTRDENGKLQDGRILMINARARSILKLADKAMDQVHTVRDLGPWFRDGAAWTKTNVVQQGHQTHIHYKDHISDKNHRVTIEPMERFVLFSIEEIPQMQ